MAEADRLEHLPGVLARRPVAAPAHIERYLDVLQGRERGDQVEGLKDHADFLVADFGKLPLPHPAHVDAVKEDLARGGAVEPGDHAEQRALPTT